VGSVENVGAALATGKARLERVDIRDLGAVERLLEKDDTILHLAVQCLRVSLADPSLVHEVNATGTLNVLRAARTVGARRFTYCSSSEVYGSAVDEHEPMSEEHPLLPTTPYGASKAAGELYTDSFRRTYQLPTTVVRPFNSYGPRSHANGPYGEVIPRFVARVRAGESPVIFGDGLQTRDFTYVEDTAAGIIAAGTADATIGETVNIARGKEVTINDVAAAVAAACGRPDLVAIHETERPADVRRHMADTRKAVRLLDYRAAIELEEGVRRYLVWVKEQKVTVSAEEARRRNW
jgi:UDP-glucose 4-epimerase